VLHRVGCLDSDLRGETLQRKKLPRSYREGKGGGKNIHNPPKNDGDLRRNFRRREGRPRRSQGKGIEDSRQTESGQKQIPASALPEIQAQNPAALKG